MKMRTAELCDRFADEIDIPEAGFQSYGGRRRFGGPIATVVAFEDNVLVREALGEPGNGRVLVVDGGGSDRRALLGGDLAATAAGNGWSGVIVNGYVRDRIELADIDLGVLALGTCPMPSEKKGEGRRDEMLRFAGVSFSPRHFIYADEDGVVVAPRDLLAVS